MRHADQDLVDRLAEQRLLDRVHRVVPDRHRGDDMTPGRILECGERPTERVLCFCGLDAPLGMEQMELRMCWIEDDQTELDLARRCSTAHCVDEVSVWS